MRSSRRKVVISCAVTGAAHTPSMSEFLPFTPEQIAQQATDAARAGAAILCLEPRDPANGNPAPDAEICEDIVSAVRAQTDALIAISTAGTAAYPIDDRLACPLAVGPEAVSVDMGAISHSYRRSAQGISEWKYGWEKTFVEEADGQFRGNTLLDVKTILARLVHGHEMRLIFECHDPSHLYNLAHCLDEGIVQGPFFIQFHFGMTGGLGSDPGNVHMMQAAANRLFAHDGYEFSVAVHGRHQIPLAVLAAIMGGHVRVGLADSLYLGKGLLATSCAAQVLKIRRILEDLSLEIASPEEAREILRTGGTTRVEHPAGEVRLNG